MPGTTGHINQSRPARRSQGTPPSIVVVTLCALLCLAGAFALTGSATRIDLRPEEHFLTAFVYPGLSLTVDHGAPLPSQPDSAPITPFPMVLAQQISVLQAHDRFFVRGNPHLPELALTFDDGPNPYYTPRILAILKQKHIQATFFCVGRLVATYPELVRQELAAGETIGNHTWSHPYLPALSASQILSQLASTTDVLRRTTGVRPAFFRPPYEAMSAQVLAQVNRLGLTTILWNDDSRDWSIPGTTVIIERVLAEVGDGAIILMHDGGGNRSQTVAALPTIIDILHKRGFRFVTLQRLVADAHSNHSAPRTDMKPGRHPAWPAGQPLLVALNVAGSRRPMQNDL